jgi:membrane peptidoglycan carboxypeptidase
MRKVTGGLVPAALWKEVMTAAEQGLPARPLDRTPEPASVSDSFAEQQVSYVDDVDSTTPQLPQSETNDGISGSGVVPGRVARNDDRGDGYTPAPQAAPSYPHMTSSYPALRSSDQQRQDTHDAESGPQADVWRSPNYQTRQSAQELSDYRQWLQTRRGPNAGGDMEPAPQPNPPRDNPSNYPTRQAAEAPPYYRPGPQVPQMPYQAYRDRPDPPAAYPYYAAPRSYYPATPYDGARYGDPRETER